MSTTRTLDAAAVAERIVETVPASNLAFTQLLGLLDVQLDPAVPTAGITLGMRPRLVLNPDFLDRHCRSDAALMMLVLHELNHVLHGHTRLYRRTDPAHNVVFDALINAQLCRTLSEPLYTALFRDLYRPDVFPEALLRPPVGWGTPDVRWELCGAALEAHQALYEGDTVTQAELFELLATAAGGASGGGGGLEPERLLGTHDGAPAAVPADPALLEVAKRIVVEWPTRQVCAGRGDGGKPVRAVIDPAAPRREAVAVVRRALVSVARIGAVSSLARTVDWRPEDVMLPFRTTADRRAEVRDAFGESPLLFRGAQPQPRLAPWERTHVYVDVSFSMAELVPLLYGALLPLRAYLDPRIHLFSTVLRDIDPARLRAGDVLTDGGTDIACVTAHMVREDVRRAVVITDGLVGLVPPAHKVVLRRRRLCCAIVLTDARWAGLAGQLGGKNHALPQLPAVPGAAPPWVRR
jgi:hypothetical protein